MSEEGVIKETGGTPETVSRLIGEFRRLGVKPGMTLLLHASLCSLGWVCGGAVSVILGIEAVLGEDGTLVMPSHSGDLSDPSRWQHPPVPPSWWLVIRSESPPYDPDLTPTRGIGVLAETFRKQKGVLRSGHPQLSFAARGRNAACITQGHSLDFGLGEGSPLARLYELDGCVLLLGVGYECSTSLHLAEHRADYQGKTVIKDGAPVVIGGIREWREFTDIEYDESDFRSIGADFEKELPSEVNILKIGNAEARFMRQQKLVDYAAKWMTEKRR